MMAYTLAIVCLSALAAIFWMLTQKPKGAHIECHTRKALREKFIRETEQFLDRHGT